MLARGEGARRSIISKTQRHKEGRVRRLKLGATGRQYGRVGGLLTKQNLIREVKGSTKREQLVQPCWSAISSLKVPPWSWRTADQQCAREGEHVCLLLVAAAAAVGGAGLPG